MTDKEILPENHPRAESLKIRHTLIEGFEKGIVAIAGLIAHGRGEAFDYLLGEKTIKSAYNATKSAVASLLLAEKPVISVNGNVTALMAKDLAFLSNKTGIPLEINLFYRSRERELKILRELERYGAKNVLGVDLDYRAELEAIKHLRRYVDSRGILNADVVVVMLEDGDRTMALRAMDKKVIAVDLNPLSRTALAANITIVDNIIRTIPLLGEIYSEIKEYSNKELKAIVDSYNHISTLKDALTHMAISNERINEQLREVNLQIERKKEQIKNKK